MEFTLNNYRLSHQISQKAGRSTYLGQNQDLNKPVVLKLLEFNELFTWDDLKLFEREAQTLKNIQHPHIPQYLDYFEVDQANLQGFALVQSYIKAPSLADLIRQGRKFSEAEVLQLAHKLLEILNYLHQLNPPIIHRDLKPSNILLTNRTGNSVGDVYLVDFGAVQTVATKEAGSITIVGSYGYIPLEQFMGQASFTSDLYSLGMTLIYLVTGVHPADLTQSSGRVKFDRSNISGSFAQWLTQITQPYPEQRYQSANLAQAALSKITSTPAIWLKEYSPTSNSQLTNTSKKYQNLRVLRDRQNLTIIYPEATDIPDTHYAGVCAQSVYYLLLAAFGVFCIFFLSPIGLFLGGFLLIYFYPLFCSLITWQAKYLYQSVPKPLPKYTFRVISITKNRYICSSSFTCRAENHEQGFSLLTNADWKILSPMVKASNQVSQIKLTSGCGLKQYNPDFSCTMKDYIHNTWRIYAELSIITSTTKILITEFPGSSHGISKTELKLLAKEMSEFLELDLQISTVVDSIQR